MPISAKPVVSEGDLEYCKASCALRHSLKADFGGHRDAGWYLHFARTIARPPGRRPAKVNVCRKELAAVLVYSADAVGSTVCTIWYEQVAIRPVIANSKRATDDIARASATGQCNTPVILVDCCLDVDSSLLRDAWLWSRLFWRCDGFVTCVRRKASRSIGGIPNLLGGDYTLQFRDLNIFVFDRVVEALESLLLLYRELTELT